MRPRGIVWHILLSTLNLLLVAAIMHVWWNQQSALAPSGPQRQLALPQAPVLQALKPIQAYQPVVDKNLFTSERRRLGNGVEPVQTQDSLDSGVLLGTIMIGRDRLALIDQGGGPPGKGKIKVVRPGEMWRGLKVMEITQEAVIFAGEEGKKTLHFPSPKKAANSPLHKKPGTKPLNVPSPGEQL